MELGNLVLGERLERKGVALGELFFFFSPSGKGADPQTWALIFILHLPTNLSGEGLDSHQEKPEVLGVCHRFWDMLSAQQWLSLSFSWPPHGP